MNAAPVGFGAGRSNAYSGAAARLEASCFKDVSFKDWGVPAKAVMRVVLFIAVLALLPLSGCSDPEVKRASVPLRKSTAGELFWFDPKAANLIVITGNDAQNNAESMALALAWPDRIVMVAPPAPDQGCAAMVQDAVKAAQDYAARNHRPAPSAPVLVGLDGDSAMIYAQAENNGPENAAARAVVALNYCPTAAPHPACALSPGTVTRTGAPVIAIPDTSRCQAADLQKALEPFPDAHAIDPAGGAIDLVSAVVAQVLGNVAEKGEESDLDLPLVELPAPDKAKDDRLAIVFSGDGGWADIDRQVGEQLAKSGVAVVGLDSLKYYWRRKEPEEAAKDLDRIVAHYTAAWNRKRVVLIGYSFGADVLPFLWQHLAPATKAKITHMALLALSAQASFEITVGGWVGVAPADGVETAPAIKAVTGPKMFCVQAGEDDEDPCPGLGIDAIKVAGDHHFNRDYKKLTELILNRTR